MPLPPPSEADIQPSPRGEGRWLCRPLPFPGTVFELPDEAARARYLRYRNWSPYIVTPIAMVSLAVARTASLAPPWLQVALALALPLLGWLALRASIGFAPRVPDHFWRPVAIHSHRKRPGGASSPSGRF